GGRGPVGGGGDAGDQEAGVLASLCEPPPPRNRARPFAEAARALPRRADRRHEPERDQRDARHHPRPEGQVHDPADRAQARSRDAALRPRHRDGGRREDRRRLRARCRRRPRRRHRLSRLARGRRPVRGRPMRDAILGPGKVNSFYGPIQVHFDLSIEVGRGQIVCLLGGNASGKSTTMKVILGLLKPRSGDVTLDGQSLLGLSTPQIIRRGIGSVPEARRLFGTMSVRENVLMGAYTRNDKAEIDSDYDRMMTLFPRLKERATQAAGTLSGGEQQMVAMARALMGRPRVLCMDEPTMGLSPLFVDHVLELIQAVNKTGVTVFMVEQNANLALRIADYGYVLQTGRIALAGPARDLLHDPRIRDAYLGGQAA